MPLGGPHINPMGSPWLGIARQVYEPCNICRQPAPVAVIWGCLELHISEAWYCEGCFSSWISLIENGMAVCQDHRKHQVTEAMYWHSGKGGAPGKMSVRLRTEN